MKTRIIIVGGFLGAGKTALLREAAKTLKESGFKVGLITNDQASELVDTVFLENGSGIVKEVSGSCFCCNFNGFTGAINEIKERNGGGVIIAEPVGSCTDLSATIMQPLKYDFGKELDISPLTVLTDPSRLKEILDGKTSGVHPSAAYIISKQFEEADIILISKSDLLGSCDMESLMRRAAEKWKQASVSCVSAKSGAGVQRWLDEVMSRTDAGGHIAEVDYDIYAEGEAVLGWLNTTVHLKGRDTDWDKFASELTSALGEKFDDLNISVGHVKLIVQNGDTFIACNITGKKETMDMRGSAGRSESAVLILNARAEIGPDELEKIVLDKVSESCGETVKFTVGVMKCLIPGRPDPTYRYTSTV